MSQRPLPHTMKMESSAHYSFTMYLKLVIKVKMYPYNENGNLGTLFLYNVPQASYKGQYVPHIMKIKISARYSYTMFLKLVIKVSMYHT